MLKIRVGDFKIGEEEKMVINEILNSEKISEGEKVREFEVEFAKFVGTKYSVTVNSGTSALIAGLVALKYWDGLEEVINKKNKKKVITTPLTYIATSNAIVLSGFEPVYVDIDPKTFVITPENIKSHLEQVKDPSEYSIILPVHLMGYPCDMVQINKLAKDYGLYVVEDSAQAHGTTYKGKKTGSLSLFGIFSFYIAHNIQAGEMGAVTTDNLEIARLIKKIKANGRSCDCPVCKRAEGKCQKMVSSREEDEDYDPRFVHEIIGYNFKAMEFQAALALTQLRKVDWITRKRNENVKYLNEGLEELSDILQLPVYFKDVSYLAYPLVIKKPKLVNRKKLRYELEKKGIETRPMFGCIPTQQPAYKFLKEKYDGRLPNAEYAGKNGFYLGCHQYLKEEDLDYIIKTIKNIIKEKFR
ncbi:MAG: DegT/DnrJ/EryC1/StrS family aminotransferase [Elusimicrobiota bacterium]|nr:DegT/DnrJ/EryC1/StrS family aminotransferase [Endomicrobiia bacterium]MDW8166621.1 DegT/DnrJ/EryC1/StrS family aminotransferase [Elusimicrobiota bacterium]